MRYLGFAFCSFCRTGYFVVWRRDSCRGDGVCGGCCGRGLGSRDLFVGWRVWVLWVAGSDLLGV